MIMMMIIIIIMIINNKVIIIIILRIKQPVILESHKMVHIIFKFAPVNELL